MESDQGSEGDDVTLNGLEIDCCKKTDYGSTSAAWVVDAGRGQATGWQKCGLDKYVVGARVRYEQFNDRDDETAMNGIEVKCGDRTNWSEQQAKKITDGTWGDWKNMEMCPMGTYACEMSAYLSMCTEFGCDSFGVTGLKMKCCLLML